MKTKEVAKELINELYYLIDNNEIITSPSVFAGDNDNTHTPYIEVKLFDINSEFERKITGENILDDIDDFFNQLFYLDERDVIDSVSRKNYLFKYGKYIRFNLNK